MRVLHVQKAAGVSGSERHLLSLLPKLAEAGVEVRMCVLTAPGGREFTDRLRAVGMAPSEISAGPDFNPLLVGALWREIRSFRADLVHTHLIHADLHGQLAARIARVPGVSSVHAAHGNLAHEPFRTAARIAGRSAALTIAISEHVGRFVENLRLSRPGAIRVIPYGIDVTRWTIPEDERRTARVELGLEDGDIAVGAASRLVPHKGHSLLLQAHAGASRSAPQLRLLIAGDGPLRADLERQAQGLGGQPRFLGFVPDVRRFLNACDVLAFPTQPEFGEGFGLAALEAMAASCPVIASDVASLPEVVGRDGAGILVDPASVDQLAAALVKLAQDPGQRHAMGRRAHERARQRFSLDAMVSSTLDAYEEIR